MVVVHECGFELLSQPPCFCRPGSIAFPKSKFIGQTDNVLCYFGKLVSEVTCSLFKSYCSSMYGSKLWHVGDKCVNRFCTAWRKGLRRIWNLPYDAHCDIVTSLSGGMSIFDELCKRSLNFVAKCLCRSWELIRFYSAAALHAMQSAVIPTANPSVRLSVCPSVRHTLRPYPDEWT